MAIKKFNNNDVVIVGNNDWHAFWFQRQQFASEFASLGSKVFYVNRTLQRLPTINHFIRRFFKNKNRGYLTNVVPTNVNIITPYCLPPLKILRPINRQIMKRSISSLNIVSPLLIAYVPSYNTIDLIKLIKPFKIAYINVHNYDYDTIVNDVLLAEKELIHTADVLLADSAFNMKRLSRLSGNRQIFPSLPGVNYDHFRQACRGDEAKRRKSIYYFGGIGPHLDFDLYGSLAQKYKVVFVGVIDPVIRRMLPLNIEILAPVSNLELPEILKDADILAIFYKNTPYTRGVIPAKFFECLASGKPLLVSGLSEAGPYLDIVYDVQASYTKALQVIEELPETETPERLSRRDKIAKEADWSSRFKMFIKFLDVYRGSKCKSSKEKGYY
jgi:hypothetical protein